MVESTDWADWVGKMGFASTWPKGPKTRDVGPSLSNQNDSFAWVVLQLLHHFAQDGYGWEGIWVQILPGQAECINCSC